MSLQNAICKLLSKFFNIFISVYFRGNKVYFWGFIYRFYFQNIFGFLQWTIHWCVPGGFEKYFH